MALADLAPSIIIFILIAIVVTVGLNITVGVQDSFTVDIFDGSDSGVNASAGSLDSAPCLSVDTVESPGTIYRVLDMPFTLNSSTEALNYANTALNGTVDGATWTAAGKYGGAYSFDGVSDFINLSNSDILNYTLDYTVSLWFYDNLAATNAYILTSRKVTAGAERNIFLYKQSATNLRAYIHNVTFIANQVYSPSQWNYLVLVKNSTHFMLGLNGVMGTAVPIVNAQFIDYPEEQALIGSYVAGANSFNGTIDEVKIWNRALSADEISVLYQRELQYWDLDTYNVTLSSADPCIMSSDLPDVELYNVTYTWRTESAAYNNTRYGTTGIANLSTWMPTWAVMLAVSVVIGLIAAYLMFGKRD